MSTSVNVSVPDPKMEIDYHTSTTQVYVSTSSYDGPTFHIGDGYPTADDILATIFQEEFDLLENATNVDTWLTMLFGHYEDCNLAKGIASTHCVWLGQIADMYLKWKNGTVELYALTDLFKQSRDLKERLKVLTKTREIKKQKTN